MSSTGQGSRNAVRQVNGAERQVTRILADLERQKRSAETEIKRLHKSGDQRGARAAAGSLVKIREQIAKVEQQRMHLRALPSQLKTVEVQAKMSTVQGNVGQVMARANQQADVEGAMRTARQFEMETAKMGLVEDVMNDVFEDSSVEIDTEADAVLAGVLDEIGLSVGGTLGSVPQVTAQQPSQAAPAETDVDARVEALLKSVRG